MAVHPYQPSIGSAQARRIVAASEALTEAEDQLREAVAAARAAGESWKDVGAALGTTAEHAFEEFGTVDDEDAELDGERHLAEAMASAEAAAAKVMADAARGWPARTPGTPEEPERSRSAMKRPSEPAPEP